MRQAALLALCMAAFLGIAAQTRSGETLDAFTAPSVKYATDVSYLGGAVATGLVVLSAKLDRSGQIVSLETVRDVPSVTARALISANQWTFSPALRDGKGVASSITLNILFNPANSAFRPVPLGDADLRAPYHNDEGFAPPQVTKAFFASNPATSLLSGPVVLDVRVGPSGRIRRALAIHDTPSLENAAIAAVKRWKFIPGKFQGTPIESDAVVVFVFRPPTLPTPPGSQPNGS